jgi:gamma-carbonic anhydrase
MIRPFQGIKPTVRTSCFMEETGIVIGDVVLGEHDNV